MIKAQDLIFKQNERENIKYKTFNKIYEKIEKKIILASSSNFFYVWYEIPEFFIGFPLYKLSECKTYIIKKLTNNGFEIEEFNSNIILIKWFSK